MDRYGDLIPEDSVEFIVMEDDRLPVLKDVIGGENCSMYIYISQFACSTCSIFVMLKFSKL